MPFYLIETMETIPLIRLAEDLAAQHVARLDTKETRLSEAEQVYAAMMKLQETIGDSFGVELLLPESDGGKGLLLSQSIKRLEDRSGDVTALHGLDEISERTRNRYSEIHYGIIITPVGVFESSGFGNAYARIIGSRISLADRYTTISNITGARLDLFSGTDADLEAVVRQSAEVAPVK